MTRERFLKETTFKLKYECWKRGKEQWNREGCFEKEETEMVKSWDTHTKTHSVPWNQDSLSSIEGKSGVEKTYNNETWNSKYVKLISALDKNKLRRVE